MDLTLQSIITKTNSWITLKKTHHFSELYVLDPAIQSCDTDQWIPYLTAVN